MNMLFFCIGQVLWYWRVYYWQCSAVSTASVAATPRDARSGGRGVCPVSHGSWRRSETSALRVSSSRPPTCCLEPSSRISSGTMWPGCLRRPVRSVWALSESGELILFRRRTSRPSPSCAHLLSTCWTSYLWSVLLSGHRYRIPPALHPIQQLGQQISPAMNYIFYCCRCVLDLDSLFFKQWVVLTFVLHQCLFKFSVVTGNVPLHSVL